MFDFLDEFDLEDFVIGANLIEEFEREQKEELDDHYRDISDNDGNETDYENDDY